jgi:hypothetical protein
MRIAAAFPREPARPSVTLRPLRYHAVELSADGRLADSTLCALLTSGLSFGEGDLHSWAEVRRGRCPLCSAMVEHRTIQGDSLEALDNLSVALPVGS